jgi:hypothetical protein
LDCLTPLRYISSERVCNDDNAELQSQATASQLDDNLVEVLHSLLLPLYERFAFFKLSQDLIRKEIEEMRRLADGLGELRDEDRMWEEGYRQRWQHDKIVRSTHGVN